MLISEDAEFAEPFAFDGMSHRVFLAARAPA
jgi:hypothetical protein